MARIKKEEEATTEAAETAVEATVEAPTTTENPENKEKEKTESAAKAIEPTDKGVLNTLKLFSNLDEAYVDSFGCVFTKDTPARLTGKAVLYKNPYFNK